VNLGRIYTIKRGVFKMVFVGLVIIIIIGLFIYLSRISDHFKFSKTTLVMLLFSIIANVSLAQNYTHSSIPGAWDGIGISNKIAYWIITDSDWGMRWSVELFKKFYETSVTVMILVTILFVLSMVLETRIKKSSH
jgi:hypothetical protein